MTPEVAAAKAKLLAFFDSPEKLTGLEMALDAKGKPCNPHSKKAVSWCLLGAISKLGMEGLVIPFYGDIVRVFGHTRGFSGIAASYEETMKWLNS